MHWCGVRFLGLLSPTQIALEEEEAEASSYSIFRGNDTETDHFVPFLLIPFLSFQRRHHVVGGKISVVQ